MYRCAWACKKEYKWKYISVHFFLLNVSNIAKQVYYYYYILENKQSISGNRFLYSFFIKGVKHHKTNLVLTD